MEDLPPTPPWVLQQPHSQTVYHKIVRLTVGGSERVRVERDMREDVTPPETQSLLLPWHHPSALVVQDQETQPLLVVSRTSALSEQC